MADKHSDFAALTIGTMIKMLLDKYTEDEIVKYLQEDIVRGMIKIIKEEESKDTHERD